MPDQLQNLLLKRSPTAPDTALPTEGQDTWLDTLMHRAGVATGVSEQKPADLGDAIAAATGVLPLGRIINAGRATREAEAAANAAREARGVFATPAMAAEFGPITAGERPPLSAAEHAKMVTLTQPPSAEDQAFANALAKIRALQAGDKEGYRRVPFNVVDANHPDLANGIDYNQPKLVDVDINKLIATQPTITEDVVTKYLKSARPSAEQLPPGVVGAPRPTDLPVVFRSADGKLYIGDGTHRIVADWAKGSPTVQAIQYPTKTEQTVVAPKTFLDALRELDKKK